MSTDMLTTIDLTQEDSDVDEEARVGNPLFMSLAHRTLSTNSSVPLKRKSDADSEATSVSSYRSAVYQPNGHGNGNGNATSTSLAVNGNGNGNDDYNDLFRSFKQKQRPRPQPLPYTPSPRGSEPLGEFSVVIPSPSAQLKKEIDSAELVSDAELKGLSERYYPTDAHEIRATRGAYPTARKTNRAFVPFVIGRPGPFLTEKKKQPVVELLTESLKSKLASISGPPVTVTKADEKLLADMTSAFEFVNEYKLREDVSAIAKEFQAGCECRGICDPSRCSCLTQEEDSNERIIPYECDPTNQQLLVLSPNFMSRTSMIYECSDLCDCGSRCWNSVIRHGRTVRLEIFHTGTRGFGLRSPDKIRRGQYIDLYLGEVIPTEKADSRERIANAKNAPSYLFNLDFLVDDENSYVVDGANYGAATRFINHSCNPNCRMFAVSRTHGDEFLYDLAFFALREISPGTELTFDYNPGMERVDAVDPGAVPCLCGESNCRGQLWANERKKAR